MSDETARIIDQEVKSLIERNYNRARQLLNDNMDILHAMKDALMKYETIDAPLSVCSGVFLFQSFSDSGI